MAPSFPAPADIDDHDADADADAESVTDTQSKPRAKKRDWTSEEDAKLTSAVAKTSKKKRGKEYKVDWVAISALVPGRTRNQCGSRWRVLLDPNVDRVTGRTGTWTAVEDIKLKDAVKLHNGKDWCAISALVAGRTKQQCCQRWHNVLDPSIGRESGRSSNWTKDEDAKLKDSVQTHGGKNWEAIAALVPGRTKSQCRQRWQYVLDHSIDRTKGRTGK
jgi:myb proto-oncogene protein